MSRSAILTLSTEKGVIEATNQVSCIFQQVDLRGLLGLRLDTAVALKWKLTYVKLYNAGATATNDVALWISSDSFELCSNSGSLGREVLLFASNTGAVNRSGEVLNDAVFHSKPRERINLRLFWSANAATTPLVRNFQLIQPTLLSFTVECVDA
jgi:hypothetical protein